MFKETSKVSGHLKVILKDKDGKVKETRSLKNLIVATGVNYIADRMADAAEGAMSHMAVGTGTTAAAANDTALGTENGRVALTSTTQTNQNVVYVATFAAGTGTGAITEAGILNASSGGTLLCRTVFSAVNKGANDTLQITWTVTVAAS